MSQIEKRLEKYRASKIADAERKKLIQERKNPSAEIAKHQRNLEKKRKVKEATKELARRKKQKKQEELQSAWLKSDSGRFYKWFESVKEKPNHQSNICCASCGDPTIGYRCSECNEEYPCENDFLRW